MSSASAPLRVLQQQGEQALRANNLPQALNLLHQAASKTSARENEYLPVLRRLREVMTRMGHTREALSVDWYCADSQAEAELLDRVPDIDRARTLQAWAERVDGGSQQIKYYGQAAQVYERCGMVAHAAICREKSEDFKTARALWSRLSHTLSTSGHERYAAGLARFNLARTCTKTKDPVAARAAVVQSVHLLEEAADRYERIGQRERAFDCYQVLIAIGKRSGEFEHVLEGFVNVVRILREDNLRYYALQSYEEALAAAEKRGEFAAGATIAQEMSQYAEAQAMTSIANYGARIQAKLWQQVAEATLARGGPSEMAENAVLAAIVSQARQGQFAEVGKLYTALSQMDLEPARRNHYGRAAKRYHNVSDAEVDAAPLPSHLRQDAAFPDVWHVDLVEWEQQGSASAACGDVVLETAHWSEITRRRALLARLQSLQIDAAAGQPDPANLVRLADLLGQIELYTILSPLEHMYRSGSGQIRLAVIRALERFMYKRTFVTVRGALDDKDEAVRVQAHQTTEALRFPHAFDPLARIFREATDPRARSAALKAIARIDTNEAAELLIGVFEHEGKAEREAAVEALKRTRGSIFLDVARRAMPSLTKLAQDNVRAVFNARGEMA